MVRAALIANELGPECEGAALVRAEELERRRVARELHDDIGQGLALLSIGIDRLGQRPPVSAADFRDRVRELALQVRDLSAAVHALSHQLHPSKLEHLGLVAAVRGLCRDVAERHDLDVRFSAADVPGAVAPAAALCLYRVAQEALRNAARHSGAAHVAAELSGTPGGVRLVVADDGSGFDREAAGGGDGLGLVSMRERVRLAGGRLDIETRRGRGTRIDALIPAAELPAD